MKLPRDLSGRDLARELAAFGYQITRESGSHLRLTTRQRAEHHLTLPDHSGLGADTVAAILGEVASHFLLNRAEVGRRMFS